MTAQEYIKDLEDKDIISKFVYVVDNSDAGYQIKDIDTFIKILESYHESMQPTDKEIEDFKIYSSDDINTGIVIGAYFYKNFKRKNG